MVWIPHMSIAQISSKDWSHLRRQLACFVLSQKTNYPTNKHTIKRTAIVFRRCSFVILFPFFVLRLLYSICRHFFTRHRFFLVRRSYCHWTGDLIDDGDDDDSSFEDQRWIWEGTWVLRVLGITLLQHQQTIGNYRSVFVVLWCVKNGWFCVLRCTLEQQLFFQWAYGGPFYFLSDKIELGYMFARKKWKLTIFWQPRCLER